ncbi:hypothetical protein [Gemmatimonas sp.]
MSALDGFLFGIGRDVLVPLALVAALCALTALSVLVGMAWNALRAWWWKRNGVRCGATHRHYPPCVLHKGHNGRHAGEWEAGSPRARHRWAVHEHGTSTYLEEEGAS